MSQLREQKREGEINGFIGSVVVLLSHVDSVRNEKESERVGR